MLCRTRVRRPSNLLLAHLCRCLQPPVRCLQTLAAAFTGTQHKQQYDTMLLQGQVPSCFHYNWGEAQTHTRLDTAGSRAQGATHRGHTQQLHKQPATRLGGADRSQVLLYRGVGGSALQAYQLILDQCEPCAHKKLPLWVVAVVLAAAPRGLQHTNRGPTSTQRTCGGSSSSNITTCCTWGCSGPSRCRHGAQHSPETAWAEGLSFTPSHQQRGAQSPLTILQARAAALQ